MPGQIAQLIVPADDGGAPQIIIPDWPRGRIYYFGLYAMRSYRVALETQTPILSVVNASAAWWAYCGDVDPLTGNLIVQRGPPTGGIINGAVIYRFDPNTFAITGGFGVSTSYPSWPTSIWVGEALVCVTCGTLASGGTTQVCYALLKISQFSGAVAVIRADTMQHAGFYQDVVSGDVNNRGYMCRGASGPTGASVFLTWSNVTGTPATVPLYTITIAPGAETYSPGAWPTTNPFIQQHTVGLIPATAVDPTWTSLVPGSLGYDATDGTVLMIVTTTTAGVANTRYTIKIDANTGAVLWATPTPAGSLGYPALQGYDVTHNVAGLSSQSAYGIIATTDGAVAPSGPLGGLSYTSSLHINNMQAQVIASDTAALFLAAVSHYDSTQINAPSPVAGTPSTFSNAYAWIGGLIPFPAVSATLADSELIFQPLDGFFDFDNESIRRLFVAASGTPAWLKPDGSLPFGAIPALYLTTLGPPLDFPQNNGDGGTFTPAGTIGGAAGPGCTPYYVAEATSSAANPQWRLTVSDDGGRTWSRLVKPREIGALGRYLTRLRWLKMGQSRERIIRLECTDQVRNNIIGIYIDAEQGMS